MARPGDCDEMKDDVTSRSVYQHKARAFVRKDTILFICQTVTGHVAACVTSISYKTLTAAISTVLCGAEFWIMSKSERKKIEMWWRRVMRVSWMERQTNAMGA